MPHTDVVQDFIEKLGHFYEIVEEKPLLPKKITNGSVPLENGHLEDSPTKTEPDTDISTGILVNISQSLSLYISLLAGINVINFNIFFFIIR